MLWFVRPYNYNKHEICIAILTILNKSKSCLWIVFNDIMFTQLSLFVCTNKNFLFFCSFVFTSVIRLKQTERKC